jgi:hypothetical protein
MPKPILSDSLFNADDVATAVLAEANLQISNNNLGTTDISDQFTIQTGFIWNNKHVLFFNGFVFFSGYFTHNSGTPNNQETFVTIDNSDYRPQSHYVCNSIGYQADSSNRIIIAPNGNMQIYDPVNPGISTFHFTINFVYNVNF